MTRSGIPVKDTSRSVTSRELAICSQKKARELLGFDTAWRIKVLPLAVICVAKERQYLTLATSRAIAHEEQQYIRFETGLDLHFILVPEETLEEALLETYKGNTDYIRKTAKKLISLDEEKRIRNTLEPSPSLRNLKGIPAAVVEVLEHAFARRASDIHLRPVRGGEGKILFRIAGEFIDSDAPLLPKSTMLQLLNRIKVLSNCDISNKRTPQDGAFEIELHGKLRTIRVSILPTLNGEQAVLRISSQNEIIPFHDLKLTSFAQNALLKETEKREGGIFLCGPTGSGKTTLLYALLQKLQGSGSNIITLEDPVERSLPNTTQVQINPQSGLDYTETLKTVLRQDPDILLLGEIRDKESAEAAIQLILTGHLVLTTLHARTVIEIFMRLKHFGIQNYDLLQSVNVLLSLRLLPALCDNCKVIDLQSSREFNQRIYQASGCPECHNTGYRGRILLTETLIFDDEIRQGFQNGSGAYPCFNSSNYQSFSSAAHDHMTSGLIDRLSVSRYL